MVKFVLHFGFVVAGVALFARRDLRFYWYALGAFFGGIALNAAYGVVQLMLAELAGATSMSCSSNRSPRGDRHQRLRSGRRHAGGVSSQRSDGRPNHLGIELVFRFSD